MRKLLVILMAMVPVALWAQFAPAQDQPGTTAMHADSSAFIGWATGVEVERGPMNISNPSAGLAGDGWPAENALGAPEGTYGVTCLGDGGYATLTFASPICNREGPDFAVFENGFKSGNLWFLEIAFVEVSSDGENFFRFPAITNVQTETQLGGFATMDPAQIHNFAGKYGAFYGTPFDLDEVEDSPLLDKDNIVYVRVIDVVGCIDPLYATYDSEGHPVNDPWPTAFASGGFDLDAVGVIHDIAHYPAPQDEPPYIVNPVEDVVFTEYPEVIEINLDGVATDPDNPDENIVYSLVSNSNETELSATVNDKMLSLARLSREESEAKLVLRATSNGLYVDFEVNVTINFVPDGIGENQISMAVYPNPATDFIRVEMKGTASELGVELFNVTGQMVLSTAETEINVSDMEPGVYFIRVNCGEKTLTERIIIK